ncbi:MULTISPECIES: efflux RND transporter permease subunit [Thiomicrorhabdus]|uniref:Efflux RND transporter permease subunit n=1 Tax=Thiomicrorhabdus heinhorstiae TaxID=2748010 RepID=A0ABS0BY68_9GAMM|nr:MULTISPECIES: efflux RND transporter permease subunit [Thiomicrorhabdus]MBF6058740.1 efflux RND transporter permease subunit [Thiomicrorhabdus heinhorstiae]
MWLSDTSVKRPVLAVVVSLLLLAFGLMAFDRMSLREYPNIDPPIVTIDTKYPGASASVVETRITKVIENRIAGISGIRYIESTSTDGLSKIKVEFNLSRDIDAAANDIRDRVSRILDNLPEQALAPEVEKVDGDESVIIWFNLVSDRMTVAELTDYAERYLVDRFAVLDGAARIRIGGGQSYALRIWLDPRKMALYGVTVKDVEDSLQASNVELPAGSLQGDQVLLTLQMKKPLSTVDKLETLIIKQSDGMQLRLGDVAKVELGAVEKRRIFQGNGIPMVGIGIIKQSNANTLTVANLAKERRDALNPTLPEGMSLENSYDASVFVESAVNEVYKTLFIALGLVVLVMLAFLRNVRAALIPTVTLPVSLIATFWVLWMLGFSVNLLTLLAMVLAIGLVVDDAIVVLENVQRHLDRGYSPLSAAYLGTRQVGFAVIATTLVLVSVFMPIGFLQGNIGRLFSEFAITLSVAVLFSSWVALTLSPALASKILRARATQKTAKRVSHPLFQKLLTGLLRRPWIPLALFAALITLSYVWFKETPQEYLPKEDRGAFFISIKGPEGASFDYMQTYLHEIEERLMPLVESGEAKRLLVRSPRSFSNGQIFNTGFAIIVLNDWADRRSAFTIMDEVKKRLADLSGIKAVPIMRSSIGGRISSPVQFVISGNSYEELKEWREIMDSAIDKTNPGLSGLDWDFEPNKPQLAVHIDYPRAEALGIDMETLNGTLQTLLGSKKVTTFLYKGEEYDILLEADHSQFRDPQDLDQIYLRSNQGDMISLAEVVQIDSYADAASLNRYNRMRSITLSARLDGDLALGDALSYLHDLAKKELPETAVFDYKGQSKEFFETGASLYFVFMFALVVIFLVLAAQFESFISPLIIMFTVPLAIGGGLFALWLHGLTLNLYSQIALILLIGLATKNGILIVEFANQLRDRGYSLYHALIRATQLRLRPILMTAITTCAGAIPLIFSSGAGAETRQILGYVLFWGVALSTLLSLFVIPMFYAWLARRAHSPLYTTHKLEKELQQKRTSL